MKVFLATNIKEIDKYIQKQPDIEVVGPVYYREAVLENQEDDFDVVILSSAIEGNIDLMELAYNLRMREKRVIYIDWQFEPDNEFLCGLIRIGFYDILISPVALPKIVDMIKHPSTFTQAAQVVGKTREELFEKINRDEGRFKSLIKDIAAKRFGVKKAITNRGLIEETDIEEPLCNDDQNEVFDRYWEEVIEAEEPPAVPRAEEEPEPETEPHTESGREKTAKKEEVPAGDHESMVVYALNFIEPVLEEFGEVKTFSSWEQMTAEIRKSKPGIVFVSSYAAHITENVASLRRKLSLTDVPIVVVGPAEMGEVEAFYAAGADECIETLDSDSLSRIKVTSHRLKQLWKMAVKDELTGLYTRKFLQDYLSEQVIRYEHAKHDFSVAMIDLDNFKSVNDTYGHEAGDIVLKELARFLMQRLRETDMIFRYGGEEFLIVLPNCKDPFKIIEQLRGHWEKTPVKLLGNKELNSTFSAGVKSFTGGTLEDLIKEADQALYKAKENGRNQVVEAGEKDDVTKPQKPAAVFEYSKQPAPSSGKPVVKLASVVQPVVRPAPPLEQEKPKRRLAPRKEAVSQSNTKVIGVGAPGVSTGSSTLAVALSRALARIGNTSAVDCDLKDRGLGVRFDLPLHMIELNDWRKTEIPAHEDGLFIFPLDPSSNDMPGIERLNRIIAVAQEGCAYTVLDAGNSLDDMYFKHTVNHTGLFIWVVNNDPLVLEKVRSRWGEKTALTCREVIILFGEGDTNDIEEMFLLPCIQVKCIKDKKGIKKLAEFVKTVPAEKGIRVLTLGLKNTPKVPGVVFEPFNAQEEAVLWLRSNTPHGAIIAGNAKDVSLLEYDLREKEIPIQKYTTTKTGELINWLRSL